MNSHSLRHCSGRKHLNGKTGTPKINKLFQIIEFWATEIRCSYQKTGRVLACMANVDLNPIRSGMVDSLDAADANVSIAERLRGLDDEPVDSASWLAPLELASEVDGQPVVVANDLAAEEIERRRQALSEQMGCLPMSLEAYQRLLLHLAIESRPELQANSTLTADQLRSPVWKDGRPVDLESLLARTQPLKRRCNASISSHACRAIRERLARSSGSTPHGPPVPT